MKLLAPIENKKDLVNKEYVDNTVDAIEIGGRNYIFNSAFLNGSTGWDFDAGVTIDTETLFGTHPTIRVEERDATSDTYKGASTSRLPIANSFSINTGEIVTISFWYYLPTLDGFDSAHLNMQFAGTKEGTSSSNAIHRFRQAKSSLVVGQWTRVEIPITATNNYTKCYINTYISRNGLIWLADFKLEKGNKATDWTPAPEDFYTTATPIGYGICDTDAATAEKVVTISGGSNWTLTSGAVVCVKFTNTNIAQNPTLNVNGTGAKSIIYGASLLSTDERYLHYAGYANRYIHYVYNGTQYVFMGWSVGATTDNIPVVSTTTNGLCPKLPEDLTLFLRSDGTWQKTTDEKVKMEETNPSTYTPYYIPFGHKGTNTQSVNDGMRYGTVEGTTTSNGYGCIFLGNENPTGKAGNKYGALKMYDTLANLGTLKATEELSDDRIWSLPDKSGTIALISDIPTIPNNFGKVVVGSTTISADTKSDSLTLVAGNNVTLTPDATNDKITISAKGTTYSTMIGATSSDAGKSGLVPTPAVGKQASFLRGDGTWVVPTDTKVTQAAAISTDAEYPIILGYNTATTSQTNTVNKTSTLLYNPSTQTLTSPNLKATNILATNSIKLKDADNSGAGVTVESSGYGTQLTVSSSGDRGLYDTVQKDWIVKRDVNNVITVGGYTLSASVPSDAKFTDTTYSKATSSTLGLVKIGFSKSGKNYPVGLNTDGQMFVNVPWENTHYTTYLKVGASATATTNAAATNGNVYLNVMDDTLIRDSHNIIGTGATTVVSDADGNITIYSKDTTYKNFVKSGTGAKSGLVPAPSTTAGTTKYLREDGTWQVPTLSNISGTLPVSKGGTGKTTLTSGQLLVGAGTGAVTTRAITNLTEKAALGYTSSNATTIPTLGTLAFWNGAYSSTSSNLTYCAKGAFGDIVTKNIADFAAAGHTHNYAGSASAGGAANSVKTNLVVKLNGGSTEGTNLFTYNGSTAKTINITPSAIGAAAASHGTHVTYATTAPLAAGTASAGDDNTVARGDHVHPAQTTVSGNAGSATKLATARTIDGVDFNGTAAIIHYGTCGTAAGTAAKTVECTGYKLVTGSTIRVKFTVTNTADNPTLNVNNTGAKAIMYRGSAISKGYLTKDRVYEFVYDGTDYELVGDINTDTNTKVKMTTTNPTEGITYYVPFTTGAGTLEQCVNNGLRYYTYGETDDKVGQAMMVVGNGQTTGSGNKKYGKVRIYGRVDNSYGDIQTEDGFDGKALFWRLPNKTITFAGISKDTSGSLASTTSTSSPSIASITLSYNYFQVFVYSNSSHILMKSYAVSPVFKKSDTITWAYQFDKKQGNFNLSSGKITINLVSTTSGTASGTLYYKVVEFD